RVANKHLHQLFWAHNDEMANHWIAFREPVQLAYQRQNAHRGRGASSDLDRSDHGDGAVSGHPLKVGDIAKNIQAVGQGVFIDDEVLGRTSVYVRSVNPQSQGIASFRQEAGRVLGVSGKVHDPFGIDVAVRPD